MRGRGCRKPAFGGNEQCPGNSTEVEDCKTSECPGINLCVFYNSLKLMILQPNGKNGAGGPNAQHHAGRGSK